VVEGASGFGTPVALGAPMLISTGHPKFQAVVVLLIFNSFSTVGGAVGTPIWFGFSTVATKDEFTEIAFKSFVCLTIGAFILVPLTLSILVPWQVVRKNIVFVMLSLGSAVLPALAISAVSYEFPTLIGGMVGCGLTVILISRRIGLAPLDPSDMPNRDPNVIGSVCEGSLVAEFYRSVKDADGRLDPESMIPPPLPLDTDPPKVVNGGPATSHTTGQADTDFSEEAASAEKPAGQDGGIQDAEDDHPWDAGSPNEMDAEIRSNTAPAAVSEVDFINRELGPRKPFGRAYLMELCGRTSPIWGAVILLILTRIPQIGLRSLLTRQEPYFEIVFNTYGVFRLSASLVFQLVNILTFPNMNWRYELLYTPFVIPFVVMSLSTMILYRKDMGDTRPRDVFAKVTRRLVNPFIALMGALVLVQLLIRTQTEAPAYVIGTTLADWFKQGFVVVCPLLGALGAFFSGSTTVSNLTFGKIQVIAAESIGVSKTSMLALQAVGGSAGNGICLNNIISACTVTGLQVGEGEVLAKTYKLVFSLTTIATIVMLVFFFRF
jgi:L-lactate permease